MSKQRKHLTPGEWQEEDSGEVSHPHREIKIKNEKKVGFEPMELIDEVSSTAKKINPINKVTKNTKD